MSARPLHLCFCNFCKGNTQLTRHKIKQHVNIYGLSNAEKSSKAKEGPSAEKKSRVCFGDASSDESDNEQAESVNKGVLLGEDYVDDYPTGYESDDSIEEESSGVHSSSKSLEPSSELEAFGKDIEEYIQGVEPIPCDEDDSSEYETSEDSSSESDSERLSRPSNSHGFTVKLTVWDANSWSHRSHVESENLEIAKQLWKDPDYHKEAKSIHGPDATDITVAILAGDLLLDLDEAIANSPPLHSSLATSSTLFETVVHLFDWFSSHPSLSKEAFSKNLQLWHSILPQGNLLPTSYQEAYKIIKPYLIPELVFDVCPNDCILFRGENKDAITCPKCKESRFKANEIPKRTFHYLPLGPRLVRNFGSKDISYLLQSHGGENARLENGGMMSDIHDSPKWKEAFSASGTFHGDPRGIGLSMCLDGLNPWSKNKANYSMWPIVLGQLNLPRRVRYNFANLILAGIIPSQVQGKEPKHLDPFLEVLIDEIMFLSGCQIYDAYRNAPFHAKVEVMIYILDYQGLGKVFCLTATGSYRGCAWCMYRGCYCKHLHKIVYPGNRQFLPVDHVMRDDCHNFPERSAERRERPESRKFKQDVLFHKAYGKAKSEAQANRIATGTGCRGMYILAEKNPSFDRVQQTMPDAMHTIAVQVKHLVKCLAGKTPEDGVAVRMQEKTLGRFKESWPTTSAGTSKSSDGGNGINKGKKKGTGQKEVAPSLPRSPFGLTKKDMEEADKRAKQIFVPAGDAFRPGPIFSRVSKLNSHEWKEVAVRGVLKYCVRGMLGDCQQETLIHFMDAIAALCAPYQNTENIEALKEKVAVALARVERDFPVSLQVITNHILNHLPEGIEKFGPVHGTWMYAYERFNSWLCRRALNRRHPEATILRTYQIFEWCKFINLSGKISSKLPFLLPSEEESPALKSSLEVQCELPREHVAKMEEVYMNVAPELQSLMILYNRERETARSQRRLKKFPKFTEWIPEASDTQIRKKNLVVQPTGVSHPQYLLESKQHSRSYLYVSQEHSTKKASIVCLGPSSEDHPQEVKFGVLQSLYSHSFSHRMYMWATVKLFKNPHYDSSSGLWRSFESFSHTVPVLLSSLSNPLTVAYDDCYVWFLDVSL